MLEDGCVAPCFMCKFSAFFYSPDISEIFFISALICEPNFCQATLQSFTLVVIFGCYFAIPDVSKRASLTYCFARKKKTFVLRT